MKSGLVLSWHWWFLSFCSSVAHSFLPSPNKLHNPITTASKSLKRETANEDPLSPLWKLASAHCTSQALCTAIQLNIPNLVHQRPDKGASLEEIVSSIGPRATGQSESFLRLLRLLTTAEILREEWDDDQKVVRFYLTSTGELLVDKTTGESSGMAFGIQHWMERPLWSSWLEVPNYLKDGLPLPFDRANEGISSDYFYNQQDHPESLFLANQFVQWVYHQEIKAVVGGYDWGSLRSRRLLDIGGHHGDVLAAIVKHHPGIEATCLDLPQVIQSAPANPDGVQLVEGNVMDPSTIPSCDAILLKHFLDRCMWSEEETVQILQNCHLALSDGGTLIIAEAVLPSIGSSSRDHHPIALSMDALYMLVGREGQRMESDWRKLAEKAGFDLKQIRTTALPTCSILVLEPLDKK